MSDLMAASMGLWDRYPRLVDGRVDYMDGRPVRVVNCTAATW
jgi:hypothetical protein